LSVLFLSLLLGVPTAPAAGEAIPCAACVTWEVTAAQAGELLESSGSLEGVDLLIRASAGDADPTDLLSKLGARGARTGVIVAIVGEVPRAARFAGRILIDASQSTDKDLDRLAFDVKRRATEVRAGNPTAEIGLETGPRTLEELDKRGTGAYMDFRIGTTGLASAPNDGGRTILARRALADVLPEGLTPLEHFAVAVDVVGDRSLTVEEVVARHQAAAARQRQAVGRLISSGSLVVTFQVPGLAAPMALTSDVVVYEGDGSREIEQRSLRLNGTDYAAGAGGEPRLPLLEPERVSVPPLAITLDAAYRYRLEGRENAEGQDCYVVAFAPASPHRALFRGRAWISAKSFALVKTETVQTGLRGPFVSSEQRDVFAALAVGDTVAWLPRRLEVHQVYEGPGHRTPIDRVLTFGRVEPNPVDFAARRAAAHASSSVMVADTAAGYRYLRRTVGGTTAAGEPRREAAGKASRVRTMAAGVIVDPNISRPLPFAGLGYVDFDFLGTGAQVNGFFGGAFAQLAWTVPSIGGSRWQAQGSGLAVLASYNDRAFAGGIERYEENLRQRPARMSLGLARPLWGQTRLRVSYELDYTRLARADTTAAEFVVPSSPVVHGLRVTLEAQRGPWSATAWWNAARRQRWQAWGFPGAEPGAAGFQRFGASGARSFVLSPRTVARVDAAWMGGSGLDRFSRYAFDGFDNRLHGYPSATLRYDRGAVVRGVVTQNAAGRLRLDGFIDTARVRDPGSGPRSRTYVGVGAGLEAPLPGHALASLEWGYGFQARGRAGDTGTHVVRVTAYKTF
jgi:hypothetical protein